MAYSDLTFFTNEEGATLGDRFRKIIFIFEEKYYE